MKRSAREILGSPPWTDQQLSEAYFADFTHIFQALHTHPGYRLHAELDTLSLSMRLFDLAIQSLKNAVETFRVQSQDRRFGTRAAAEAMEQIILAVQAALFQVATTAAAYKARARALGKRISVPDFDKPFTAAFSANERHGFVQHLRDHLSHVAPLSADWELSRAGRHASQVARFLLFVDDLKDVATQGRRWDKNALQFIERHRRKTHDRGGEIDVVALFDDYAAQLHLFHAWLVPAAEAAAGPSLTGYRDSERRFYRIVTRSGWKAFVIPSLKRNPRAVLNARLTPDEIACVDKLPAGSPEQINQLIKFIDDAEYNVVDSEIREAILQALGLR